VLTWLQAGAGGVEVHRGGVRRADLDLDTRRAVRNCFVVAASAVDDEVDVRRFQA